MPTCTICARAADPGDGDPPLGWSLERAAGNERRLTCPACTREHVRAIEAKLDARWW